MKIINYLFVGMALLLFGSACNNGSGNKTSVEDSTVVHVNVTTSSQTAAQVDSFLNAYYSLQLALSRDDSTQALQTAGVLSEKLNNIAVEAIKDAAQKEQTASAVAKLNTEIKTLQDDASLESIRATFQDISGTAYQLIKTAGLKDVTVYKTHCPMAFDGKGADWLSKTSAVRNPYMGKKMITCGLVKETMEF